MSRGAPIAPDAAHYLSGFMIALLLIAVVYIALVALVQQDMKKLIAYSSISHMGFVTLGLFIFVINGLLLWAVGSWLDGFRVDGFWAGVLGAIVYGLVSWALSSLVAKVRK